MSLKVWYPLVNGLYKNQGSCCDGDIYSTSSFTSENVGNLGTSTYNGGVIKWTAEKTSKIFNNKQLSIAFWIKPLKEDVGGEIFGNNSQEDGNNRKFSLFQYSSNTAEFGHGTSLHWSWMNDEAGKTFTEGALNGILPKDKWTHVVFAYNNPVLKIHINGMLDSTIDNAVSNSSSFAYETTVFYQNPNRYIQDLRVYNHCLSEYEIKELSKGLCCYYDFNQIKAINDILPFDGYFKNSDVNSYGLTCRYNQNGVWNNGNIGDYVDISEDSLIFHKNSSGGVSNHRLQKLVPGIIEGHTYRLHCNYCVSGKIGLECAHTNAQGEITYLSSYSTEDAILEAPSANLHVFLIHNNSNEDAIFKGMYLEDITKIPSYYSDKSGFGNHLTISNNVAMIKDTTCKVGTSSGKFNGVDSYVALPQSCKISGPFTYNIWAYMDNWSEYGSNKGRIISCTDSGGYNIEAPEDKINFAFYAGETSKYSNNLTTDVTLSSLNNEDPNKRWHMFTFTLDPVTKAAQCFIDGEPKKSVTYTGIFSYNNSNAISLGAEASDNLSPMAPYFKGKLDDFRLYASCLSDEDIKDLYNCRMKISNNHNVYCSEFIESDSNSSEFKENGQILMSNFTEGSVFNAKYLKFSSNGNNINADNHISKISYTDMQGKQHIILDAVKDPENKSGWDGIKWHTEQGEYSYFGCEKDQIYDFGENKLITNVFLRRYYRDNRTYYQQKIEYSLDKTNWSTIYDSKNNDTYNGASNTGVGLYNETEQGKWFTINANESFITKQKDLYGRELIEY